MIFLFCSLGMFIEREKEREREDIAIVLLSCMIFHLNDLIATNYFGENKH